MNVVVVLLFFLSGATALSGEVVWMRLLGLVVGNTTWAASAVVTAWMAGLALGSWLGGRLAPRTRRQLRWFAAAEGGVAAFYLASPAVLRLLERLGTRLGPDLSGHLGAALAARFALAVAALIVPTTLMGLTLPLLVERWRGSGLSARTALLYGGNTAGGVAGVVAAAYLGLPVAGASGTLAAAAMVAGLTAAAAVGVEQHVPAGTPAPPEGGGGTAGWWRYGMAVAAMGSAALLAEIAWVRVLVLHLGSRVYTFSLVLALYLAGLAAGGLAARWLAPGARSRRLALAWAQLGAGAAVLLGLAVLGRFEGLLAWLGVALRARASFGGVELVAALAVAAAILPATVLYGASFPLAVGGDPAPATAGGAAGRVSAANTLGAIAGAALAPVVLGSVGVQRTLLLVAAVHAAAAVGVAGGRRRALAGAGVLLAAVAGVWLAVPREWVLRRAVAGEAGEVLTLEESLTATVIVRRVRDARGTWLSLELNGVNVAGTSPELLAIQQLQGHLPLLQHPDPRRVLHIGLGTGATCWAVSRHPVERIDVVEIAPEVVKAADRYFRELNHGVLHDPRVHVILNDGRNYLLATRKRYDAILSDSIHPVYAGNGTLYTEEYFRLCREHLRPGGVVSMWLPMYSLTRESFLRILSAFRRVFPRTAVWYDLSVPNEFTVVTGVAEPGPIELRWEALADPRLDPSLAIAGVHRPEDLAARLLLGPKEVAGLTADIPPEIDDLPYVEYVSGRLLDRDRSWLDNFLLLLAFRARLDPFAGAPFPWPEVVARRDTALRAHGRAVKARLAASP